MNVHFPQDEISRSEAYNIVNANNQYARPSNGDPLRALIQVLHPSFSSNPFIHFTNVDIFIDLVFLLYRTTLLVRFYLPKVTPFWTKKNSISFSSVPA